MIQDSDGDINDSDDTEHSVIDGQGNEKFGW